MKFATALAAAAVFLMTSCVPPRPVYNGFLEFVRCDAIQGWAFDWNRLSTPVDIALYDGDKLLRKFPADNPRPDLNIEHSNHGFHLQPVPGSLLDGKPHKVHLRFGDSKTDLRQSPKLLSCEAP